MDIQYIIELLPLFFQKLPFVIKIIGVSFIFSFIGAILVTVIRIKKIPLVSKILDLYVSFIRSLPNILILFLVYYGLPVLLNKIHLLGDNLTQDRVYYGILSIVLYNIGYTSEILRAGIQSLPADQEELADSLGYNYLQKLILVILPQTVVISIKDIENSIINIMKDTSIFFTIGIMDLLGAANTVAANNYGIKQTEVYMAVAVVYWFCSLLIILSINIFEAKYSSKWVIKSSLYNN